MFDWIGFVTEAAVFTVPYTLEAETYVIPAPLPDKDPAATVPETVRLVSVPRLVMFGWALAVTAPEAAILPITFAALMFEIPEPFDATKRPLTTRPVRVPTLVMFGWAGFDTLKARFETTDAFAVWTFVIPVPSPYKNMAFITPVWVRPVTVRLLRVPRPVMFDCRAPVTTWAAGTVS